MEVTKTLKFAAGGAVLFCTGALVTALALGRVELPQMGPLTRGQIEQVVHDYLIAHPDIIIEMSTKLDNAQQANADKAREDALFQIGSAALFDPKVAYVTGPADAKVTVAEFFDYRCPHCKASQKAVEHLLAKGQNVRVAFIERPILTPDLLLAAQAAVASRRQGDKYVPFHFALMASAGELPKQRILDIAKTVGLDVARLEKDMSDPAVLDAVKQSNALADRLRFDGTPTFVVNNRIFMGELTDEQLQELTKSAATSG